MTSLVQQRVRGLYEAFGDVPRPDCIPHCHHCRCDEEFEALLRKDLREITADEFWQYAHSVFWTAGSEEDFLYYCPRLLELAADASPAYPIDVETVCKKLRLAEWSRWREDRRRAVVEWSDAVFESMREEVLDGEVDSWVCAMAQFRDDVAERLGVLLCGSAAADENLIQFYEANSEGVMLKNKLSNSFWDKDNPNYAKVLGWLKSGEVAERVNAVYEARYAGSGVDGGAG